MSDQLVDESMLITGWCKDCPPGTELGCCPPAKDDEGYPVGPPQVNNCYRIKSTACNTFFLITTDNNRVFGIRDTWIREWDITNNTWIGNYTYFNYEPKSIIYVDEIDKFIVSGHKFDNDPNKRHVHGSVLDINLSIELNFNMPSNYVSGSSDGGYSVSYYNGGIYLSGFFIINNDYDNVSLGLAEFNINDGSFTGKIFKVDNTRTLGTPPQHIGYGSKQLFSSADYRTMPDSITRRQGTVWLIDIDSDTITKVYTGSSIDGLDAHHGATMHGFKNNKYALLSQVARFKGPLNDYINSDNVLVFNTETGELIKTLVCPSFSLSKYNGSGSWGSASDGNGFGYTFSKYGNFFILGALGAKQIDDEDEYSRQGGIWLYDHNFNLIQRIDNVAANSNRTYFGSLVAMNDTNVMTSYELNISGILDYIQNCPYTNYGV